MRIIVILSAIVTLASCKPKEVTPEQSIGSLDLTVFVAIGGDRIAGYQDDALSYSGQQNSLGAILQNQFEIITPVTYNQPFIGSTSLGINLSGDAQLVMGYKTDCNNETSLSPVRYATSGNTASLNDDLFPSEGPFHNMGVPSLSITDIYTAGYANPFYQRFISGAMGSVAQDLLTMNPTFFLSDLGHDDILSFALGGGEGNPIPDASGANSFEENYNLLLGQLSALGAKGVLCNIPDVTKYPYFTTIPYDGLDLDAANASTMNQVFNPLGMSFVEGANPFTVEDPNEPFGVRKLEEGELILLSIPLDSVKCNGMGSIVPIPEKYVLTLDEISEIQQKTAAYNSVINLLTVNNQFALADFNSLFNSVNLGWMHDGINYSGVFVSGGFFSLDGRNPTSKGMALMANKCIEAINAKYNASIPHAVVGEYDGVKFP